MISLPLLAVALWIQTSPAPPPSRSAAYGLYLEALSLKEAGKADEALAALRARHGALLQPLATHARHAHLEEP